VFGAVGNRMNNENRRNKTLTIVALAGALAVGLPFLNKPFHIDDPFVLAVAEQICRDPLRPFSGTFDWFSDPQPIFNITTNPPFLSYWLAPVLAVCGPSEIALHLAMLPFLILWALATATLSKRFAQGSLWPVLFVMLSPAVVVSPNIMRDVPAAALVTAAVALFVTGTDRNKRPLALAGSALAGLAMVTKYSALVILPVLALYPLLQRKPRFLLELLAALAVLGCLYLQNYLVHGQVHFFVMESAEKANLDLSNLFTAALVITGAAFLVMPGLLAHAVRRRDWLLPVGALVVALATARLLMKLYPGQTNFQYCLWAILGAVTVFWVLTSGLLACGRLWRRPPDPEALDAVFLLVWLLGPYMAAILFVEFPAVRHILPAAAPIVLLAVRYGQRPAATPSRWVAAAFGLGLAAQAVIAFWTAAGDYQYADTYRRFAREDFPKLGLSTKGRIWFNGHWGWKFYALEAGWTHITKSGPEVPKPGDLLIVPDTVHRGDLPPGLQERLEQIVEKRYPARLDVITMDWVRASFYATFGVTCPQYFGKGLEYEVFRVFRVKP